MVVARSEGKGKSVAAIQRRNVSNMLYDMAPTVNKTVSCT